MGSIRRRRLISWFAFGLALVAVAESGTVVRANEEGETAMDDPLVARLVAEARSDLAARLEIDEEKIEVTSAERVTWRDSSLGCPKPDTMYMQMLQAGVRIELRAEDESYAYHSNLEGPPFYCETPSSTPPLPADEG